MIQVSIIRSDPPSYEDRLAFPVSDSSFYTIISMTEHQPRTSLRRKSSLPFISTQRLNTSQTQALPRETLRQVQPATSTDPASIPATLKGHHSPPSLLKNTNSWSKPTLQPLISSKHALPVKGLLKKTTEKGRADKENS